MRYCDSSLSEQGSISFNITAWITRLKNAHAFDKTQFEALLNRRFFYAPAFEIYGGIAGLYDYRPPGSSLQDNIISEWTQTGDVLRTDHLVKNVLEARLAVDKGARGVAASPVEDDEKKKKST